MNRIIQYNDITLSLASIDHEDGESRADAEKRTIEGLVAEIFGENTTVGHKASGAPFIPDSDTQISISHSRHFAALACSRLRTVGVDIEEHREQLRRVAPRVLSAEEMEVYSATDNLLLRAWTLKEALYKAALTPGLDFRRDIALPLSAKDNHACVAGRRFEIIDVITGDNFVLSLVAGEQI